MNNKKLLTILLLIILLGGFESCKHLPTKENTWTDEQKTKWKTDCQQWLIKRGLRKIDAKNFCDCMLKKTSEKYTPEEATKITPAEERKLWNQCDYRW
jgi:hypothetical protein